MSITATYTAETIFLIVNNQTNSTRTSTIKNTEINFANISTPTNTNSAGTVTTSISLYDGNTITATFPTTPCENYASTYAFCGTLPTVISGTSTCLTIQSESCSNSGASTSGFNTNNGVFTFPSHPPLPVGIQTDVDLSQDPRGWTYVASVEKTCDDQVLIQPLFPDLGVWSCEAVLECASPEDVLETALYLTVTSTSHEAGLSRPVTFAPMALAPAPSLVPLLPSQPAPSITSVPNQDHQPLGPAPYNQPTPGQSASISPTPGVQPASPNQPAQDKQPAPNNSPSPPNTVPNTSPDSGNEPGPNNQPAPAVSGTPISLAPAATALVIGIITQNLIPLTLGTQTIIPNSQSQYIIGLQTLTPGGAITVSGTPISLAPSATAIVIGTSTHQLAIGATTLPTLTIGTLTVPPNSLSQYIISSQTLTPGGLITLSGTPVSLAPSATAIVIGTSTHQLAIGATTLPTLTIGTLTVPPNSLSQYIISSQSLTPGGRITLSGTPISLAAPATALIIGSSTIPLGSSTILPPPLTIGSQVFTANSATQYIIGSQTLTPGGVVSVSGTRVSLAPGDTAAVVGTRTEGLAALITAGLGLGLGNGNGTAAFTGGAKASGIPSLAVWLEGVLMLLGLGVVVGL